MTQLILVWHHEGERQTKAINSREPLMIGRHPNCDIVLGDPHVSRRHATIFPKNGGFLLQNLSRTNPIIFNEQWKLPHGLKAVLEPGDRFELGKVTLQATLPMNQPATLSRRCASCGRMLEQELRECPRCHAPTVDKERVSVAAHD